MKKTIPLFLILIYICTACAKSTPERPPTIPFEEIDWENAGAYKDKYILSQERIEGEVRYINDIDILIDEALKAVREKMQESYEKGELPWDAYAANDAELYSFKGNGYYISKIPITTYCNNLNMLLDNFSLSVFNEDMTVQAEIYIENLNNINPKIHFNANRSVPITAEEMPDMEFIKINVYNPPHNTTMFLGEDNHIYGLSDNTKAMYDIYGDVFNALPEDMRFSYNKIIDKRNLIWVEYEK
ncbi:MAG: hypothetical protein HDT13_12695 [Butyrivibrio sp.]|nr:hypothetical protein [Butyrivibrio sp.]